MPVVVSCMLCANAIFVVISKLTFIHLMNITVGMCLSINSSGATEKHTNLLTLSFSCDLLKHFLISLPSVNGLLFFAKR